MKIVNVIPINKLQEITILNKYTPISLLPQFSKMLEELLLKGYEIVFPKINH